MAASIRIVDVPLSSVSGLVRVVRAALPGAVLFAGLSHGRARAQGMPVPIAPDVALPAVEVSGGSEPRGMAPVPGYAARQSDVGTKTDTPLIETPQSISVVTEDQIRQQDAQTLNQALHYTPGVVTEQRGGVATRYDQLTVRGFTAETYYGGLRLIGNGFYAIPQIDPFLLSRIDVLRGASSVLYGQSAAGGIIDQQPKLPTLVPAHEVGLEFGNLRHVQGTFDLSGPIDQDGRWSYRLTGIGRAEDGQVAGTRNERLAVAPALTWRPDDATSLTLMGLYQHDPRSTSYGGVPPVGTVFPAPYGFLPRNFYDGDRGFEKFDRTQVSLGYLFETRPTEALTVRSRARWFHIDQDYASVYYSGYQADGHTLNRGIAASRDTSDTGTLDNSVEYRIDTGPIRHTLLAGFDYQHLSTHYDAGFATAPTLDVLAPNYNQDIVQPKRARTKGYLNQYGTYFQDQLKLGHWVLTLSGRQDWAQTYQSNATYGSRSNQFDRAFTGRAGLVYVFDNGIAPYLSYAESFVPQLGTAEDGSPFKPETGRQYEVGIKYQPPGTKVLLTAAAFDLARSNLVTPDLADPLLSIQSGQARSRGVEMEARASVLRNLDVVGTYTYLDTVYTRDNSGLQGKRLAAIPQHSASAWLYYKLDDGPLDGLGAGGGARYTGSTFNDQNTFKVRDYVLVDGSITYDLGRKLPTLQGANVYLNARNLLDEKYVASCYYANWCAYGYGRQVMGGMRYSW